MKRLQYLKLQRSIRGSKVGFRAGEKVTMRELLLGLCTSQEMMSP